ncbi:MAG: hypothetical protein JNK58_06485 [Phycisphaerae bacterium]|nr:hypothetical protein [Phycisphaerae bacterium]
MTDAADPTLSNDEADRPRRPLFRVDPGWLFLCSGISLLAATVMIPALDDLRQAEWNRDRARAVEDYRKQRLSNYSQYLEAVRNEDRSLVVSLAATQLNLAPADKQPMLDASQIGLPPVDVLSALEPSLAHPPSPPPPRSTLQKWATNARTRPWLLGAGGLFILIGLMPASRSRPRDI